MNTIQVEIENPDQTRHVSGFTKPCWKLHSIIPSSSITDLFLPDLDRPCSGHWTQQDARFSEIPRGSLCTVDPRIKKISILQTVRCPHRRCYKQTRPRETICSWAGSGLARGWRVLFTACTLSVNETIVYDQQSISLSLFAALG